MLRPLEVVSGVVLDDGRSRFSSLPDPSGESPIAALERAILPALRRPPCLVSFSGGRDSSAVLAVAAKLARREGLPLPIPATNRFPEADESDESDWQEQVVEWLGLEDWLRPQFTDELDAVGPVAAGALRRHGLLWPCNAHFHVPLLELASGGSLLTGAGGDEVFGPSCWARATAVLGGRVRPELRDVLRVGLALAPPIVRERWFRTRVPEAWPWLHPEAQRALGRELAAGAAREPLRWKRRLEWIPARRYLQVGLESLGVLAGDSNVALGHPLLDAGFVAALARLAGGQRYTDRTSAMRMLFGDLLPEPVLSREGKARFNGASWTTHSRSFVRSWQGEGADEELVDAEVLRQIWLGEDPHPASFTLLQSIWLRLDQAKPRASSEPLQQQVAGSIQ